VIICYKDQLNIKVENCFKPASIKIKDKVKYVVSMISSLSAIYRHRGSDYLGFDIGLICHGLGLDYLSLGLGLDRSWSCCFWSWS